MWQAMKALDLRGDPRFALHSGSADPPEWTGDAKLAGGVEEITNPERKASVIGADAPPEPFHPFRADVTELVVVRLGEPTDHIVVESWHAGRGVTCQERRKRATHPRSRAPGGVFTELPRRSLLGNLASGVQGSRKPHSPGLVGRDRREHNMPREVL